VHGNGLPAYVNLVFERVWRHHSLLYIIEPRARGEKSYPSTVPAGFGIYEYLHQSRRKVGPIRCCDTRAIHPKYSIIASGDRHASFADTIFSARLSLLVCDWCKVVEGCTYSLDCFFIQRHVVCL
jgi:hypothetical protein